VKLISSISDFQSWRQACSGTIGFVPTMGALHSGHLSLVHKSNSKCDLTIVSIYVNPAQFTPGEDLSNYPRDLEKDLEALSKFQVDVVFFPDDKQMYPQGFSTFILEDNFSHRLEGKSRPEHFKGVLTIVGKLFNIIRPSHAFFGEKDAQQIRVLQKMVTDLNYNLQIVPCPIVREANGLAMSSRNIYLSENNREKAGVIHRSLKKAEEMLVQGYHSVVEIREVVIAMIKTEKQIRLDYFSIVDNISLKEIHDNIEGDILVSIAVFFLDVRLIDNFTFQMDK
jgi:pantoate--beta-alanine ligase